MSYNISKWKQTHVKHRAIPLDEVIGKLLKDGRVPMKLLAHPSRLVIEVVAGWGWVETEIYLDQDTKRYYVMAYDARLYGAGSGTAYARMQFLLRFFFQEYEATLVWESGDTVEKIRLVDGNIVEEKIA